MKLTCRKLVAYFRWQIASHLAKIFPMVQMVNAPGLIRRAHESLRIVAVTAISFVRILINYPFHTRTQGISLGIHAR